MPPAAFELAIPASNRPQTHTLDRAATEIGGFDPRTIQPVAGRRTNYAIPVNANKTGLYEILGMYRLKSKVLLPLDW